MASSDELFSDSLIRSYIEAPHFVERPWITAQIAATLDDPACRFVLLTAEPGAGKSSIIAWLADHPAPTTPSGYNMHKRE